MKINLADAIAASSEELGQLADIASGKSEGCIPSATLKPLDIELGKDGSSWKHDWVPLNAAAVALKAHKKPSMPSGSRGPETPEERSTRLRAMLADARAKAASRAPGKARAALGDNLQVLNDRTSFVNRVESELDAMPTHVLEQLKAANVKAVIYDGPLTNISLMSEMRGVRPRGWPPGRTWDDIGGVYHTSSASAIASQGLSGAISTIGHELGHGYEARVLTDQQRRDVYAKLRPVADSPGVLPYFKQPGNDGVQELFAETFGAYTTRGADGVLNSMAGMIPDRARREELAQIMMNVIFPTKETP